MYSNYIHIWKRSNRNNSNKIQQPRTNFLNANACIRFNVLVPVCLVLYSMFKYIYSTIKNLTSAVRYAAQYYLQHSLFSTRKRTCTERIYVYIYKAQGQGTYEPFIFTHVRSMTQIDLIFVHRLLIWLWYLWLIPI